MIIFVQTRYYYQSYDDFWELVKLSEFPTCHPDEIDWQSNNIYIVTPLNGEIPRPFPERKCKMIWLNIERFTDGYEIPEFGFDEVWLCDKNWADKTGKRFFFMASDERLGYNGPHNKKPVTLAYVVGRRIEPYQNFDNTQAFCKEKKELLANAKALVVLHQDVPVLSPQRFCYAAAAHLPVFYEEVPDFHPFVPYEDFIPVTYENVEQVVRETDTKNYGDNLFKKCCLDTNFRLEVEKMFEV
jgi:hypothetical protein